LAGLEEGSARKIKRVSSINGRVRLKRSGNCQDRDRPTNSPPMNAKRRGIRGRLPILSLFPPDPCTEGLEFLLQALVTPVQVVYPVDFRGSASCYESCNDE